VSESLHNGSTAENEKRLGLVVSGSLGKGVEVKLDSAASVEDIAVGRYVTIEGEKRRFFGMITDVALDAIDQRLMVTPPDISDPFIAEVLSGTSTFGRLHVRPELTLGVDPMSLLQGPQPVKTVPAHFSVVKEASEQDVEWVFGRVEEKQFWLGTPLDMETKVRLDPPKLVERSSGVFGKSGTGKTFLARLLLIGIVQENAAVNLVFDMHSEYGWMGTSEQGREVKALKQLFGSKVAVFTLDEENARRRGVSTDFTVEIGYDEVEPEDISMLRETLNLTERGIDVVYELAEHYGRGWLWEFLSKSDRQVQEELKDRIDVPVGVLRALRLSLNQLKRFGFMVAEAKENSVKNILAHVDRAIHVVLEFGRYRDNTTAYVLVANLLTRRIHDIYVARKEQAGGDKAKEPKPLVITIEEAHKFLSPDLAGQTIFGTIAREMRKYNVTLLVIDQRPSGIEDEVMSQIGTKITCLLDNERDVDSVLTGVAGKSELKAVLSKLETKQQALIFGHAVPMPVVVRTREYGSAESYKELGFREALELKKKAEEESKDLWE